MATSHLRGLKLGKQATLATCHHISEEYLEACSTSYLLTTCHHLSGEYSEACSTNYSCHKSSPEWRVFLLSFLYKLRHPRLYK